MTDITNLTGGHAVYKQPKGPYFDNPSYELHATSSPSKPPAFFCWAARTKEPYMGPRFGISCSRQSKVSNYLTANFCKDTYTTLDTSTPITGSLSIRRETIVLRQWMQTYIWIGLLFYKSSSPHSHNQPIALFASQLLSLHAWRSVGISFAYPA